MIYPTVCLDNFFNDPLKILEFSNSLQFYKDEEGKWPGERSKPLHEIDPLFFNNYGLKVMSILYPTIKNINFNCILYFQKISNEYINEGWVHKDDDIDFTSIVYLSKHKNCGTSIFNSKKINSNVIHDNEKKDMYLKKDFVNTVDHLKNNNNQFEETINIKSKFNRFIMFDSAQFHAAQKFTENNVTEDRLTLIGFFNNIYFPGIKYNGIEHKRLQ
jgi:hypothetical protein